MSDYGEERLSAYGPRPVPDGHRRCPDCVRDLPFTEAYWKLYPASKRDRLKATLCPTRCADCQREWWRRDSVKRKADERAQAHNGQHRIDLLFMRSERAIHHPQGKQRCRKCMIVKQLDSIDFPLHNGYTTGLLTVCRACTGVYERARTRRRMADPDTAARIRGHKNASERKRIAALTPEQKRTRNRRKFVNKKRRKLERAMEKAG